MKNVFRLRLLLILILLNMTACAQNKDPKDENTSEAKHLNRLKDAKSPYLQMHADNPVDWYEWGPEALQKAKKENKPLLISIGYASCHWCHVMERESFMDSTTAKLMNDHFVCIKVDREERPDIDQIYMSAAQLLNGQGGWPLNAFALPDGKPFFAGTYFPNKQWKEVLQKVAAAYENKYEQVVKQANALTNGIRQQDVIEVPEENAAFSMEDYKMAYENLEATVDFKKGGYRNQMKFPLPVGWEFALQYHYLTGNEKALKAVQTTLTEMARGGIYDQIGGGFARYSTDENWFAPHFEKMLYDNGQLISLYANAYKVDHKPLYVEVIRETLDFVKRELTDEKGGFYSSIGADSEGEEGQFYVWKSTEIDEVLNEKTAILLKEYFQVKENGNWENGENILFRKENTATFAKAHNLNPKEWEQTLKDAKEKLLEVRAKRERPATDDKVLTGWNALMMQGYLDAYTALDEEEYLKIALKNANFLKNTMLQSDGKLFRTYRNGNAGTAAFLGDYALLAQAYLKLYQVTFDKQWLDLSHKLTEYALTHFQDKTTGMFFYTSDLAENLVARKTELSDNVIPSSNSVMASVLFTLGEYYDKPAYKDQSKKMLANVLKQVKNSGPYYANWSELLGLIVAQPNEVAIMGTEAIEKNIEIQKHYLPTALFMGGEDENLPLLENKLVPSETIIYVCKNKTCQLPVQTVTEALKQF